MVIPIFSLTQFSEMILKFYRRRKELSNINIENLLKLNLPYDYLGFGLSYDPQEIVSVLINDPYRIGIEFDNEIIPVQFIDIRNANFYKVDYGDEIYEESIVMNASNNIPEGGIYLDLLDNCIYNLKSEPVITPRNQRQKIMENFNQFLNAIRLYQLSNSDTSYFKEIDLKVPEDKDELKLPWE